MWKFTPYIEFVDGVGPLIMACRNHNDDCNIDFIHLPRQTHHILPSHGIDQLCHAVTNMRTVRPIQANKYSNTCQIQGQRGSFQGIDTCDVCSVWGFSFSSIKLVDVIACNAPLTL